MTTEIRTRREKAEETGDRDGAFVTISCWAALAGALLACLWFGSEYAIEYASRLDRFKVNMGQVDRRVVRTDAARSVAGKSDEAGLEWMGPRLVEELRRIELSEDGQSIFDKDLPRRLYERYKACPWVSRVHYVRKEYPNTVRSKLDVRRPLARVGLRNAQGDRVTVIVDSEGLRLPDTGYVTDRYVAALPLVIGAESKAPVVGARCEGADAKAGVAMAGEVMNWPDFRTFGVTKVDVSDFATREDLKEAEVALWTTDGTQIRWGHAPGSEQFAAGEAKVADKVAMLKQFHKRQPLRTCEWVSVRHDSVRGAVAKLRGTSPEPKPPAVSGRRE